HHLKFRALPFSVSICKSGSYISRGRAIGFGSRLSSPLPPRLASSPRPDKNGNASSFPDTRPSAADKSFACSTIRWVTPLACCTLPRQPSMEAPRIAAILLKDFRPHDEIGVGGFVFERDEHDALGRARHLPHQH